MRGIGLRMGRAVPINEIQKMGAVAGFVAGGTVFLYQGDEGRGRGHAQHRKGPCVQFVDKRVAQRVVCHGVGFLVGRTMLKWQLG